MSITRAIVQKCLPYTMLSVERLTAIVRSTQYLVECRIPGDFAQCGVWRGGAALAMALTLDSLQDYSRQIYLLDTFNPADITYTDHDIDLEGFTPQSWIKALAPDYSVGEVLKVFGKFPYPMDRIRVVEGRVETTLPLENPPSIAFLHVDVDFYHPSLHVLNHLYPHLVKGGILNLDDYGHWKGQRQAVDEYFTSQERPSFTFIDYTAIMGIKP